MFDLAAEMRRRDVSSAELARAAQLSRGAVAHIRSGRRKGRPGTRRALRAALGLYPVLDEARAS